MTKGWLVWGSGPLVLLLSTIAILGMTGYLYAFPIMHLDLQRLATESDVIRYTSAIAGAVGAIGGALLYVTMWFYWARIDDSSGWKRRIWFLVLLLALWYGSCLYYFAVYRPQVTAFRNGATT
jgi:hypothetical protein